MAKGITEKQRHIYNRLKAEGDASLSDLAAELGITYPSLRQHVLALEQKGFVKFEPRGVGRSPRVRVRQGRGVPLVGQIMAGPLSEALEFPEGYLKLSAYPGRFGLRVKGDSMADRICDGDIVLLTKRVYKSGDICAVRIDRSDATLKYVDHSPHLSGTVVLRPHNPEYESQEVALRQLEVDGVYSGLLRGDVIDELLEETMN